MNNQDLVLYYPQFPALGARPRSEWTRFFSEAQVLLRSLDGALLRDWAVRSLAITVETTARRVRMLWGLVKAVANGAWEEFKAAFRALWEGRFSEYASDLCKRVWNWMKGAWAALKKACVDATAFVGSLREASREELVGHAAALLGAVIGFVLIGGTGDGGLIDKDIVLLGLGAHRSIWFHSVFVGIAAEAGFRSMFELLELLHRRLPAQHSPLWDRMRRVGLRFRNGLVTGSWVGVTTHLAIDSHIDGWTPYKDLPVALPEWGHHLVMDLNAAASGFFAWHWYDKVKRRFEKRTTEAPSANGVALPVLAEG